MSQVILVAHGKLSVEMKNSAEMICGKLNNFKTITFIEEDGFDTVASKIKQEVDAYAGDTLIFTDIFCGTPYNASCQVCMQETTKKIEVVSGMSLPIILEIALEVEHTGASEMVSRIKSIASNVIKSFKDQQLEEEEDF